MGGKRCDVEIKSVIDHIFLRGRNITACAALAAPEETAVAAAGCLPNAAHPSDHIPLIVDVGFKEGALNPLCSTKPRPAKTTQSQAVIGISCENQLLAWGQDLPHEGRVELTEDGFKYVALPKQWQTARNHFVAIASTVYTASLPEVLAADQLALERQLARRQSVSQNIVHLGKMEWGFWSPPSCVGLHISLGKHADSLNVGKRIRFQLKKLLHFQTRKLGEPSKFGGPNMFCARWFTFEVKLIDEVHCDGEEPHISFAVFGVQHLEWPSQDN